MDTAQLEGTWQMIRAELAGEAAPALVSQKTTVTLVAGTYEVRFAGEVVDRGSYEVSATLGIAALVLHGHDGPNAGRTIPCRFQLKGDRLRVCYGLDGAMPTEMSTQTNQQRYLATYRRAF